MQDLPDRKTSLGFDGQRCIGLDRAPTGTAKVRQYRQDTRMLDQPIAQIKGLRVEFETKDGPVVGVENVSFDVTAGETLCIVGESGSGKSVSSLSLMRLVEYGGGTIAGGRLMFNPGDGEAIDLAQAETDLMKQIRGNQIGMIFQEPMTALNPVFTVGRQLTEGLRIHKGMDKKQAEARAHRDSARGPHPRGRAPHEAISARTVRRDAPAGGDRDGDGVRAASAHRG